MAYENETPEQQAERRRRAQAEAESHGASSLPPPPVPVDVGVTTSNLVAQYEPSNGIGTGAVQLPQSENAGPVQNGAPGGYGGQPAPNPTIINLPAPVVQGSTPTALPTDISRTTTVPQVQAAQAGRVELAPPPVVGTPRVDFAGRTAAPALQQSSEWQALQREAATSIRNALTGQQPTAAQLSAQEEFNRARANQLSMMAGARGRSVASANRTAANNIASIDRQAAAEIAKITAQEQAQARGEAAQLGTAARGQDIDLAKTAAENTLRANLASDDRLQGVLSERAKLKLQAAQGNQDAAVKLQSLQGQLDGEMERFNAKQLQDASADDAANFLKGVGLDDDYTNAVRNQWLELQRLGQTERLELLRQHVLLQVAQIQQDKSWWEKYGGLVGAVTLGVGGAIAGGLTGGPVGAIAGGVSGAKAGSSLGK